MCCAKTGGVGVAGQCRELGGGIPETKQAKVLSELLGVNIMSSQVVQDQSPFRNLLKKFENELIIATGKGDPALVMSEYGFKKTPTVPRYDVSSERIKAAFVVSDPADWGKDIQVLCDILRSGGLPGDANRKQPPLYFAADDLEYQNCTREHLQQVRINPKGLEYVSYGKPNPFVFKNAEAILSQLQSSSFLDHSQNNGVPGSHPLETLYMIGDNPSIDVKGAQQFYFCLNLEDQNFFTSFDFPGGASLVFYFDQDRLLIRLRRQWTIF
ncbi:hypothetical protein CRYUN_Cryun01aG0055100 [Craigia yunnanensis]